MFEEFIDSKLSKSAEKIADSKVLPLAEKIEDLTSGIEIITDVVSAIPKMVDEKVATIKKEIKVIKGENGKDGKNGKDGTDGKDGLDGLDGIDGSPDTAKDIAKKLNTLKGAINKDVIIGLDFASQSDIDRAVSILDQRTQYLINKTTTGGGGGGGGPFSDITGQPYQVAYFDASGNGTSDQYFVRDDINFNTTLITPIDADRSVKLITDSDGSTLSVPAIANLYEDSNLGITTGFFISGELGSESSQMIFQDGINTVSLALDSVNAVLSYANADFTTSFSATDIGAAMAYNDTLNSVQGGLSFGSQYVRLSRITDDTVQIGAVEIGPTYLEIYRRVTGLRRHGSILMQDDLITIGDPTAQSTDTNIIVDIANEVITLSTGQTSIDSGQIIKGRTVVDASITIGLDDYLVTGASISVDRVASLPAIGIGAGEAIQNVTFIIKNKSNSSANITLTPDGTDTIDGAATLTIIPGQSYTIVSDGSGDWEVI